MSKTKRGIGHLRDDPRLLAAAILYLLGDKSAESDVLQLMDRAS